MIIYVNSHQQGDTLEYWLRRKRKQRQYSLQWSLDSFDMQKPSVRIASHPEREAEKGHCRYLSDTCKGGNQRRYVTSGPQMPVAVCRPVTWNACQSVKFPETLPLESAAGSLLTRQPCLRLGMRAHAGTHTHTHTHTHTLSEHNLCNV